jgi:hypothetical protein
MSLEFNADKQIIKGSEPRLVGSSELSIRAGSGSDEKEVVRVQLDPSTKLPRVGVNRTGRRVEKITINSGFNGSGYTIAPSVTLSAPQLTGGIQALASAIISAGAVVGIIVDNPGDGYTSAPTVTISGGNGSGAAATAFLDTVDYELDVNGAIRTSTSIISDTARILNLDIDNFVTADAKFRSPALKTYANNTGILWSPNTSVNKGDQRYFGDNIYEAITDGITASIPPTHLDGDVVNGTTTFKHIGFRVNSPLLKYYNESIKYPRSVTPPLGDRTEKIATTEYVLNLATNDVGGRVYVSQQIGDDANDGRSAVNPVRTIKRACQIASQTVGTKETVVISGGDYVEDNPISIPPDCSIVGDNLRLVIVRPNNPRKHMFKFGDKNYVTGITFRDKIDSNGDPIATWDYAMVFDDKQRIYYDVNSGGDFGRNFPVGHQIFGVPKIRVTFQTNTGLTALAVNEYVTGVNTGSVGIVKSVTFNSGNVSGTADVEIISGSFQTGETFTYPGDSAKPWAANTSLLLNSFVYNGNNVYSVTVAGTTSSSGPTHATGAQLNGTAELTWIRSVYSFVATDVKSIRAEGEVVSQNKDLVSTLPITRIDGSLQSDPNVDGIVIYTSPLIGRTNTHDFKENEEIEISGLPTTSPDLSWLNGKQRVYKIINDADGRSRRIVIPKKSATFTDSNYIPNLATVKRYSYSITLSLLNSPNKFETTPYVSRRFQDACNLIRNNIEFIKDETYLQIADEFNPNFSISSIKATSGTGSNAGYVILEVTTSGNHGFFVDDNVTIYKNGLNNAINSSYPVYSRVSDTVFQVRYFGTVSTLGLTSGNTYNTSSTPALSASAYVQRSFVIPNETKCRRDIGHFVNAIIMDLEYGGNYNVVEAAQRYIENGQIGFVGNEIAQTVRAFEIARKLCILAMRRWRTRNGQLSDPLYTPVYSSVARYFDPTVSQDTSSPACNDVSSAINTLSYLFVAILTNNSSGAAGSTTGTQLDAGYLIQRNADFIASEALGYAAATYPSLISSLTEDQKRKCKRDIRFILSGLTRDLILGGNAGIVTAAESYFTGAALTGIPSNELTATRYAFEKARDLAIQAIRNWSGGTVATRTPSGATYDSTTGVLTVTFPDPSTPVTTSHKLAFKEGALTFNCSSNGGGNLASPQPTDRNYGKSLAITNVTSSGGNTTVTVNVGNAGTATGVSHTFVSALANGTIIIYDPVTPVYETTITRVEDWNILLYGSNPLCSNVASAITTEMLLLDNILSGSILPGATAKTYGTLYSPTITYPEGTLYDANNRRITPRGTWDDLPYIEASPYTQNASVISFLGGNGAEVDGNKVAQPNCPFPGLELNGSASFPNQGKSMVASAFTIVSFGGTGYKIINDGYVQLVSVFVIFCADGVYADTGGYASVTNSATNFGIYALRARGYREEPYVFDIGTITNVTESVTGKTVFTVSGLGRRPLEHYVVKFNDYRNTNTAIEYFVDAVSGVTVGPPFTATLTLNDTASFTKLSTNSVVANSNAEFVGKTIKLHRPSIVNSSSHTWEFAGSGTNYNALPENGGTKIEAYEQVSEFYGRVYTSGTDELGDFKVGYFARIENRTGAITFTGTVTISEVEFLKLKGGDVVVTGFDASPTLGGAFTTDSKLPTQKAVKDYITNNLGPYINKPYSTNAVPRALVELTDSGKISIDQIPALRPFNVFTVANQTERLALEGALAGDIAIQADTTTSYILNNDLTSLYAGFTVDTALQFTIGNIFTGSGTGGQIQATEYRQGVVYKLNITNSGSGYTVAPTVTISGGDPQGGAVSATAVATIANGQVVTLTITENNGFIGGKGYTTSPTVTIAGPGGAGVTATASALIESRLYGTIVNNIKLEDTDNITSNNTPTGTVVNVNRVVNTSSSLASNWVSLSSNQISADAITSGVIATTRLANNSSEANSFTFLRGDQSYAPALQSIKGSETRYFAKLIQSAAQNSSTFVFATNANILKGHGIVSITGVPLNTSVTNVLTSGGSTTVTISNPLTATVAAGTVIEFTRPASPLILDSPYTIGSFIDSVVVASGGTGFTNGTYTDVSLSGGTGTGLKANITVSGNSVTSVVVTNGGINYTGDFNITNVPAGIGSGSGLVLSAKLATTSKNYANTSLDIRRVDDLTITADPFGNAGIARFQKSQFTIGASGNGSVTLKTGADSGLDADLLDGAQGSYYLNASNLNQGVVSVDRLSGTYNISVSGQSGNTLRLITSTNNPTSSPSPNSFSEGIIADTRNNSADSLDDGGSRHLVMTLRNFGSGFDSTGGGVRQLAFTDNDNMWIRGSGTGVTTFGSWAKIWTSINDGPGTGLDADKLDNKQGVFYQNAYNINAGLISDNRLPSYQSAKSFNNSLKIFTTTNNTYYDIYIPGFVLTASPFLSGQQVFLYNVNAQNVGGITITNVVTYNDADDALDYTIISGVLTTGVFTGAETIGTASNRVPFQDFTIRNQGTFETASLESATGTALLRLGRKDGTASSPSIYFNSSASAATNYNIALIASGGSSTDGSGNLNIVAGSVDAVTINNQKIWNAGNLTPASNNVANTVVLRDGSGNFAAGTITATLTGSASLNVLKTGDTMTGSLNISGASSNLSVGGTSTLTGNVTIGAGSSLTVDTNTLYVDPTNDRVGIGLTNPGTKLEVSGAIRGGNFAQSQTNTGEAWFGRAGDRTLGTYTLQLGGSSATGTLFEIVDRAWSKVMYSLSGEAAANTLVATSDSRIGIGRSPTAGYKLDVNGTALFSDAVTIATTTDQMLYLNATDNSWAYMGFAWSGTRRYYFGLDSGGNGQLTSDSTSYSLNINGWSAVNMNQNLQISGADSDGLRLSGTAPTITFQDSDNRSAFIHVNSNLFYILGGANNAVEPNWAQVANSRWPLTIDLTNNNATFGGAVDTSAGTLNAQNGLQLKTWSGSANYTSITHSGWTGSSDYAILLSNTDPNTYISAKSGSSVFIRGGGNGTTGVKVDPSGYVGIRTESTSSSYALQVGGAINIQGEIYKNGTIFNTLPAQNASTIGATLKSDGTNAYWAADPATQYQTAFTISRGYSLAGYKDATSWKNVNSLNHSTFTQSNLGDLLSFSDGYCAGAQSLSMIAYVFTTADSWDGTSATVSKVNMNTNANAGTTSVNSARNRATLMRRDFRFAYVYGAGGSQPSKFNLTNDTSSASPNGNPEGDVNNPAGGYGPVYGWTKKSNGYSFPWATETYVGWSNPPGTDGSNKTISSRNNAAYWNTGGGYQTGNNWSKRTLDTGTEVASIAKNGVTGEETLHTGNSYGFMCGMYNGAQNNQGGVMNYAADTWSFNSSVNRVGPPGAASGAGTEFGSVISGYTGV